MNSSRYGRPFSQTTLFVLVVMLLLASCAKSQNINEQSLSQTPIRAVTENAYPPLNFADAEGKGIGLEYELTNKIAQVLGRSVDWNLASWDVMIQSIRQNMYDVGMDGIAVTPERQEQVDFSVPFLTIRQVMLVRSNENRFTDVKQFLSNPTLKIGAQTGTTNFYVAVDLLGTTPDNPGPRIVLFEHFGSSVQALLSGDVDMVILDEVSSQGYARSTGGRVKSLPESLSEEEIAFIFPKGSPLVAEFNSAIESFRADGTLDRMANYWFTQYGTDTVTK